MNKFLTFVILSHYYVTCLSYQQSVISSKQFSSRQGQGQDESYHSKIQLKQNQYQINSLQNFLPDAQTDNIYQSESGKVRLLQPEEIYYQPLYIWSSYHDLINQHRALIQQRIENITCRIGRNQVKAIADYNAKCSSTNCTNFLDYNCIFNNVYWIHVVEFCVFSFGCFGLVVGIFLWIYTKRDFIAKRILRIRQQLPNKAQKAKDEIKLEQILTEDRFRGSDY